MAKKTPVRLHKVEEKKPLLSNLNIVEIGIILGLILMALLFFLICLMVIPPTMGYYWY